MNAICLPREGHHWFMEPVPESPAKIFDLLVDPLGSQRKPPLLWQKAGGGQRFNPSILRWKGRLLMACRIGWLGSRLYLTELSEALTPVGPLACLWMESPLCRDGQEDPRLFTCGGRLWLSFVGVDQRGKTTYTHQMLALLTDDLQAESVVYLEMDRRQWPHEKNWSFFDDGNGQMRAVYRCGAWHTIVKIDREQASVSHQTTGSFPWRWGEPRGGAPPVLVGDEFYHWFHGTIPQPDGGKVYSAGLYVFDAAPPFRVKRVSRSPLMMPRTNDLPDSKGWPVVFPGGAVLEHGRWLVAYGYHDYQCRIAAFDADEIESRLEAV